MAFHTYVDESKASQYLLMGVLVRDSQVADLRHAMKCLLSPGQQRIHFTSESAGRKINVLEALGRFSLSAIAITTSNKGGDARARERCLRQMCSRVIKREVRRIIIEQDDASLALDRRVLYELLHESRQSHEVSYGWQRARQEPLLWTADALAWSWAQGGAWASHAANAVVITEWIA